MGHTSPKSGHRCANRGHLSIGERCSSFLRHLYPARTADNVAADTGLNAETIAKMLQRQSDPSAAALGRMILAYGPDFIGDVVLDESPAWLSEQRRAADLAQMTVEVDALKARLQAALHDAA